jgi:uncharacterized RDD family membrane protein YckC
MNTCFRLRTIAPLALLLGAGALMLVPAAGRAAAASTAADSAARVPAVATSSMTDAPANVPAVAASSTADASVSVPGASPETRAPSHRGHDLVGIGHDSILPQGEQAGSVVAIAGSSTSNGDAHTVVSIIGNTRVTGSVADSAVAILGDTYVDGKVAHSAVAVLGNVELGPHADIGGDVVAVGGEVNRDPAAIVHGQVQSIATGTWGSFNGLRVWVTNCLFYGRPLAWMPGLGWAWTLAILCLALYLCIAALFRDGLIRCVHSIETQPGQTVLAALIAMLATPVLVVLLCLTVIGIPAVPFVLLGLFCAGLFGKAVMLAWIGRRVLRAPGGGAVGHPATAVLIGGVILLLLYMVPVLGFVLYKLLGILGFGAVVYTLLLALRARHAPTQPGPTPAGPAPSAMAGATAASAAGPAPEAMAGATSGPAVSPASESAVGVTPGSTLGATAAAGVNHTAAAAGVNQSAAAAASAVLPHAGFWIRMAALLLDVILVGIVLGVLGHHSHLHLVLLAAYGAVLWKVRGSTVGGIVCDLRVVRVDGQAMDWQTAIVRALGCFLSLAVAGLGFFWIAFDPAHQAWHDKIAGTVVVRVPTTMPRVSAPA